MEAAIAQSGMALQYADDSLRSDPNLLVKACLPHHRPSTLNLNPELPR